MVKKLFATIVVAAVAAFVVLSLCLSCKTGKGQSAETSNSQGAVSPTRQKSQMLKKFRQVLHPG
jgi:archaellin